MFMLNNTKEVVLEGLIPGCSQNVVNPVHVLLYMQHTLLKSNRHPHIWNYVHTNASNCLYYRRAIKSSHLIGFGSVINGCSSRNRIMPVNILSGSI